jgi:hypothetical protein
VRLWPPRCAPLHRFWCHAPPSITVTVGPGQKSEVWTRFFVEAGYTRAPVAVDTVGEGGEAEPGTGAGWLIPITQRTHSAMLMGVARSPCVRARGYVSFIS